MCCGVALHVIKTRRQFFGGQVVKIEKYRRKIGNPIPSEGPLLFSRNASINGRRSIWRISDVTLERIHMR